MKLGLFSDSHYCRAEIRCKTRRPSLSLDKIREAMTAFREAEVDLCLCLGDIVDKGSTPNEPLACLREAMEVIRASELPFRILAGNHDTAVFPAKIFEQETRCQTPPYVMDTDTHRLIFLDANYSSDLIRYDATGSGVDEWKDTNLPPEQLDFLQKSLDGAQTPCIVLLHQNLEAEAQIDHRVNNAATAQRIMESSGKVSLVIQGHYHPGADRTETGIRYLTLPAMCEGEDNHFIILEI